MLYGPRYTDLCDGYAAFRRGCLDAIALDASDGDDVDPATMQWEDGLEVETLINVRIAKADPRVFEMPRFERSRIHGNSNFIGSSDGLRVHRSIQIEH